MDRSTASVSGMQYWQTLRLPGISGEHHLRQAVPMLWENLPGPTLNAWTASPRFLRALRMPTVMLVLPTPLDVPATTITFFPMLPVPRHRLCSNICLSTCTGHCFFRRCCSILSSGGKQ